MEIKHLYRYDYDKYAKQTPFLLGFPNGDVKCYKFDVVKETPCGYWIDNHKEDGKLTELRLHKKKWVSKTSGKKWAHTTKEAALNAYIRRKSQQVYVIKQQLSEAKLALKLGELKKEEQYEDK